MLGWLRERPARARLIVERILEGMRELGVLFLAFAPLDAALSERSFREVAGAALFFSGLGCSLYGAALVLEWRSRHDD